MKRREILFASAGTIAVAGCAGNQEEPAEEQEPTESETEDQDKQEIDEQADEPDPANFEITNLVVEPTEVSVGKSVSVTATVENTGGTEGTNQVEFIVDGETLAEQVSIPPGETTDVSVSITQDTTGSFEVNVADQSVTFDVIRELNQIGESYEGPNGLTVTLESFEIAEKTGSYEYLITYTLENEADEGIDEGQFQLYPLDSDNDPLQQYGAFDELFPGDTVERSYTFEEEKDIDFGLLAYHPDQFFEQSPPADALVWAVEY